MKAYNQGECMFCGSSDAGTTYPDGGYKCYSCQIYIGPRGSQKPVERLSQLPRGYVAEIPFEGLQWLYEANMTDDLIVSNGIGWDKDNKRVVFPITVENTVVGYTARCFGEEKSYKKYHSIGSFKKKPIAGKGKTLVLVEDMLSFMRISQYTSCACLLGTGISYEQLQQFMVNYATIVVWLDSDKEGQSAAKKIIKKSEKSRISILKYRIWDCSNIATFDNLVTKKDPKGYSNTQLKEILSERIN